MKQSKVLSLLGIAMRGHNLVSGESQTLEAVRKGSAVMVVIAEDASENTRKLFANKCTYYGVPFAVFGKKEELGRAIGKDMRSSIGVCNGGLADAIMMQLEESQWAVYGRNGGEHGEDKGT